MLLRALRPLFAVASVALLATSCSMDLAPTGLRRTPDGPGARVRFDLAHKPLPEIPLPSDTATWPDPTSRTGLRVNASLVAPTEIEQSARERFSQMEGWGTFAPISVAFDLDRSDAAYRSYDGTAIDLANMRKRHQGDDYDFSDDAIYLVNLSTGVPVPLDLGAGNFNYTLKKLDKYGIRGSISLSTALITHHPEIIELCKERDWEFFTHGIYNTRYTYGMSEAQERGMILESMEAIEKAVGRKPAGYLAPALSHSEVTVDLFAELGGLYTCDLFHDDQPTPVKVRGGQRFVSVPYSLELNDTIVYVVNKIEPRRYGQMIKDSFDRLYAEGAAKTVWMDMRTGKSAPIPDVVRALFDPPVA
mgnify:CR=1 FL=1